MSVVSLEGVDLHYEVHGDGPPLVFIHGASGFHLTWWQQVAHLRHHFTCIIYDQRGFGRSRPTADYDVADLDVLYSDLRALIEHTGFGDTPIRIIGASMGTAPALRYAMLHADQIERLLLVCGTGNTSTPLVSAGYERRVAGVGARKKELETAVSSSDEAKSALKLPSVRSPGEVERFAVAAHRFGPVGESMWLDNPAQAFLYAEIMAMADGPSVGVLAPLFAQHMVSKTEASKLGCPVLVVGGSDDPMFHLDELAEVAELFPNGKFVAFKGAGHAAYYEKAHRFNELALNFLS